MSAGTSIRFEDAQFQRFFDKVNAKAPKLNQKAVNVTTASTLRAMKSKFLPRRTGDLASSYQSKKLEPLSNEIFSPLKKAAVIEFGGRARTVHAKPGKHFLTIPIKKSVLTTKTRQIKKSALDKLFRRLKNKKKGEDAGDVMQSVGIVLAKKANLKRRKGQRNIERNAQPFAEGRLFREVRRAYRSLGFN